MLEFLQLPARVLLGVTPDRSEHMVDSNRLSPSPTVTKFAVDPLNLPTVRARYHESLFSNQPLPLSHEMELPVGWYSHDEWAAPSFSAVELKQLS